MLPTQRALISVFDKTGLEDFARALAALGIEILSTGGTQRALQEAGIPVTPVADVTEHPEILGGRVKTLHPKIHGGLLGRRGTDEDVMEEHGIDHKDRRITVEAPTITADEYGDTPVPLTISGADA